MNAYCGSFDTRLAKLKTYVEGGSSIINFTENEIRKFCFNNNVEIVTLEQRKSEWLMKTLYIELKGAYSMLESIEKFLKNLSK